MMEEKITTIDYDTAKICGNCELIHPQLAIVCESCKGRLDNLQIFLQYNKDLFLNLD